MSVKQHLMARGQIWGRMLDGMELASTILRGVAADAGELLDPKLAKLSKDLYDSAGSLHVAGWEQYLKAHKALGRKKR